MLLIRTLRYNTLLSCFRSAGPVYRSYVCVVKIHILSDWWVCVQRCASRENSERALAESQAQRSSRCEDSNLFLCVLTLTPFSWLLQVRSTVFRNTMMVFAYSHWLITRNPFVYTHTSIGAFNARHCSATNSHIRFICVVCPDHGSVLSVHVHKCTQTLAMFKKQCTLEISKTLESISQVSAQTHSW